MTRHTLLLSRHPGAREWLSAEARRRGWEGAELLSHLTPTHLAEAQHLRIAGVLPIGLAAGLLRRGAECWTLDLDLAPQDRGRELDARSMQVRHARLKHIIALELKEE